MALADVYDALISKRIYKPPMSHEEATQIIVKGKGKHFDPDVVDAFLALENTFRNIALTYADFDEEREILSAGNAGRKEVIRPIDRILVVEDNQINREIMQSQLAFMGYRVDSAVNGIDALEKHQNNPYDVILTDIDMPVMDGYALAKEIRRLEKSSGGSTPILAITASDYDLTEERAISLGFNGYMLKPLEPEVFKKKLIDLI
jgi:response regulator RpfG family c-di-GMP phosphodiesterase